MRTTLTSLYSRYSARLAAAAAEQLAEMAADPVRDADDVTQDVWLAAAQLRVLPEPEFAWPVLTELLDQALGHLETSQSREFPSGMEPPAARALPPAPLEPLPSAVVWVLAARAA
ncbi:hypothetical protein OHA98_39925 [Streptomyces sp. NBC_00654]|uniref:hypothetical protein n=1 Tax=Streptomyces sp. NBC_00654 TaxID=2975799 RepID=UPI00224EE6DD|nr:hypothetical protein [Streptomyces sp. NBC_00654]MCX4970812.1 hypothetical protein [Streptomyces sp. NBC_00654]